MRNFEKSKVLEMRDNGTKCSSFQTREKANQSRNSEVQEGNVENPGCRALMFSMEWDVLRT